MGLFDIFGTGDQKQAAQDQIAGINAGLGGLTNEINSGVDALNTSTTTGLQGLNSNINQGNNALTTNFTAGLQPFLNNNTTATQGVNQYANALGLNGTAGNAQATAAFQNNPGYQFQLQQGDDAINAAEAATGKLFSGNQLLDLSRFNQGLAGTGWGQYMSQLGQFLPYSTQSASGVAQGYQGLGTGLNQNANTVGTNTLGAEQNFGNQVLGANTNIGNAIYGANTSIGNANANADLAGLNASANGIGALLGIGKGILGFLSDERVKEDIEKVGELYDGQPIFSYRYMGDPRHQIGLIAQNVEDDVPDATFEIGHLKGVDYHRATRFAAELGRYA